MPRLPIPLKPLLRDGFGEADVRRVWRNISSRPLRGEFRGVARWSLLGVTAALVLLALFMRPRFMAPVGPLEMARGGQPSVLALSASEPKQSIGMADGSEIVLDSDSRLEVLANDSSMFVMALRRGRSTFNVRPGGPRRWVVECGLATVEVVGTQFTVERGSGRVMVSVARGTVAVRGELVPDRLRRIEAGQSLVVVGEEPSYGADGTAASVPPTVSNDAARVATPTGPPPRALPGAHAAVGGARSNAIGRDDLDDLLQRADVARNAGDFTVATDLLEKTIRQGGRDPRTAVAALTLARLKMSSSPERAARVLSTALAASVPRGLEEDMWARLVEARSRSGDRGGASKAATEYEARFPNGARLAEVRRWLAP